MANEFDEALDDVGADRRSFLKRVVVGSAFAVPVVASFSMSGVQAVYAQSSTASGSVSGGGASATTTTSQGNTTTTTTNPNQTPSTTTTTFQNVTEPSP